MNHKQIVQQSKNAYKQWAEQWRAQASHHKKWPMKPMANFQFSGIGKAALCVANGYSFEENIDLIKKYQKNVDILCCDKTLGHLLNNGITPTFCLVCDANVSYEKYMEPYKDQLKDTVLFMNVCANPKWSDNGNWKDRYFFVNMDVMGYEKEFSALSGCKNFVTAGTNVSNMMIVLLSQCDNHNIRNFFAYDKIILIGYDYSWKLGGKYYAFDDDGGGKTNYMRHIYGLSPSGKMIYTSNNLNSSATWIKDYVANFKLPVVQCSKDSIAEIGLRGDLESNLKHRFCTNDASEVRQLVLRKNHLAAEAKKIDDKLKHIGMKHHFAHLATV